MPRKSGALHDSRVSPDQQGSVFIKPQPDTSRGGSNFAAFYKGLCTAITFEGTRDVRVLDRAKTLQVAAWLHRLDMSASGDGMASETLEALQHSQGPLLESFLAPMMSNLTFKEVVDCVLHENWCNAQYSLDDLRAHRTRVRKELDVLTKTHGEESDKSS